MLLEEKAAQAILATTIKMGTTNILALSNTNSTLIRHLLAVQSRAHTLLEVPFKPMHLGDYTKDLSPRVSTIALLLDNTEAATPISVLQIVQYQINSVAASTIDIVN